MTLARFRANPHTIRVGVRAITATMWKATITLRDGKRPRVVRYGTTAARAVALALREASNRKYPGIDIGMGWAYEHPQSPRETYYEIRLGNGGVR